MDWKKNLGLWLAVLFALLVIPPVIGMLGPVEFAIWMVLLAVWAILFLRSRQRHEA